MTTVTTRRSPRATPYLVGHFALTITVQYPPSLKSVVLLEVKFTVCNKVTVTLPL